MSHSRIPVILLGLGNVGQVLLRQILATRAVVAQRTGVHLLPVALADISGLVFAADGLPEATLNTALHAAQEGRLLADAITTRPLDDLDALIPPEAIVADVTASPHTAAILQTALDGGGGAALANKIPLAASWKTAQSLFAHSRLRYECTVGAGLPVINTLHGLLDTGDQITRIEGCLSGTLGYLCSELERGIPYSAVVTQARALGYTEPDPRQDLSGQDVARKALILARVAGWPLDIDDLTVKPLYPAALADGSPNDFMAVIPSLDQDYAARFGQAQAQGNTLRYVAQVGPEGGTVGLQSVPQSSPLGTLFGPANYIALHTARYNTLPLVIAGPGAGPEVTAAGVLGDILALARRSG